jgi:aspartate-semialdehyde dehydrogenase
MPKMGWLRSWAGSRIMKDTIFDFKFTLISHNTIRGAAGAALLNAELLVAKELI